MALDIDTNWQGLLDMAAQPPRPAWKLERCQSITGKLRFTDTASYGAAMELLRFGWTQGRDQIVAGLRATAPATMKTATRRMDVAGAYPVVPLAVAGEPACMVDMGEEIAPRPTTRMVVGVSFTSDIKLYQVINRGVAICRVVDALEQAGTRVELVAAWNSYEDESEPGDSWFKAAAIVKEAHDPLELDRIAFTFAHPSINRRIGFRLREITKQPKGWIGGYGETKAIKAHDYPDALIVQPILRATMYDYATPAKAFAAVCAVMADAGIDIEAPSHA